MAPQSHPYCILTPNYTAPVSLGRPPTTPSLKCMPCNTLPHIPMRQAFVDLVALKYIGDAQHYVIHAWSCNFLSDLVVPLLQHFIGGMADGSCPESFTLPMGLGLLLMPIGTRAVPRASIWQCCGTSGLRPLLIIVRPVVSNSQGHVLVATSCPRVCGRGHMDGPALCEPLRKGVGP